MKSSKGMIYLLVALIALTVVVGVGMLFFFPKENKPAPVAATTITPTATPGPSAVPLPDQFDPVEWTRNPQPQPLQSPLPGGDSGFTVTLPTDKNVPNAVSNLPPSPGATFPGESTTPGSTKPEPTARPNVAKAVPTKAPTKVARPAPKTGDYWIQVASFRDRFQAENTAKSLESQGLKGLLTTATVSGNAVVRVRVGPYSSETEAGKVLGKLKSVKEFETSYITKATANRGSSAAN